MTRLALGTVQFGLAYGVTNASGQVPKNIVAAILQQARTHNIDMLDTAAAYGQSETVLESLGAGEHFQVVSKTLPLNQARAGLDDIELAIQSTLNSLAKQRPLYGLMVHHAHDLLSPQGGNIWAILKELKQDGRVKKIGVSVYSAEELDQISQQFDIDLIQVPHNILDQRLSQTGYLQILQKRSIEVHVRSAFLQGLLLQEISAIPAHLQAIKPALQRLHQRASELNCSLLTLCLGYLRQQTAINRVLVGVQDTRQLSDICSAWEQAAAIPADCTADLAIYDEALLNPAKWSQLKEAR